MLGLINLMEWVFFSGFVCCQKPAVVNIGAIFTFDSVIGRAAKPAIEAAVADVNANPMVLNGTQLKLVMRDANCSAFLGSTQVFQVIEKEVVAIIGPQSSEIAHIISEIANGLQVPLVSFAATDPTLSFPFFVRTTQSDFYQMAAMADLIDFYGWKEVIAIYVDDEYGRNGISALDDQLQKKSVRMNKFPLSVSLEENETIDLLRKLKLLGLRVYVVHGNPDPRLRIFSLAQKLQMMTNSYVWLATDWLSATLDSFSTVNQTSFDVLQGVVGLRQHIPESNKKKDFVSQWRKMKQKGLASSELNTYGLFAYDTVWTVTRAIDKFISNGNNFTFSFNDKLVDKKPARMQLNTLKVFDGGQVLLSELLQTNFSGLTGQVLFSSDQSIVGAGYEVINIDQMAVHTVGYWSNQTGFSVVPAEALKIRQNSSSQPEQELQNVTWPGGSAEKPRGWEIATNEEPLRIAVPYRASFVEFVTELHENHTIQGYCIDVFNEARKLVPYYVPYRFELFGDGRSNPNYNQLVKNVANNVYDAAVGDIAIVKNRTLIVDFSQPYIATGLVIVAPIRDSKSSAWVFLEPFTLEMWFVTAASFFLIAVVMWILEHRVNNDFRGPPRRQIATMFLFSFSTLFKKNQEDTVTTLGRLVMVVWLFVLMVITSSYTANLTSILTVRQLSSPITGIESLITSNWPIGYQVGSFAYHYLMENLNIHKSRLVELGSPEAYEKALRQGPDNGGVAAIVDELPYIELFLSKQSDFGIIGQPFTKSGWGFAFQRDSQLAVDISTAILKLSENGKLEEIHDKWFCTVQCPGERVAKSEANQLHLVSFWGLYLLSGGIALTAFLVFLLRVVRQFVRYKRRQRQMEASASSSSSVSSGSHKWSRMIYNFFDFIDEKEEAIKKMFPKFEGHRNQNVISDDRSET